MGGAEVRGQGEDWKGDLMSPEQWTHGGFALQVGTVGHGPRGRAQCSEMAKACFTDQAAVWAQHGEAPLGRLPCPQWVLLASYPVRTKVSHHQISLQAPYSEHARGLQFGSCQGLLDPKGCLRDLMD